MSPDTRREIETALATAEGRTSVESDARVHVVASAALDEMLASGVTARHVAEALLLHDDGSIRSVMARTESAALLALVGLLCNRVERLEDEVEEWRDDSGRD